MIVKDTRIRTCTPIKDLVKRIFRETYGVEDDVLSLPEYVELRNKIRDAVFKLRESYYKPLCDTDYSNDEIRKAYMIAYYPYYIEPARYVMETHVLPALLKTVQIEYETIDWDDNGNEFTSVSVMDLRDDCHINGVDYIINLSFFASGPCPELLGVVKALDANKFCDKVNITTFDSERNWLPYQKTTSKFCEEIMPIESWGFYHYSIGDMYVFEDDVNFLKKLQDTQVFFMQNYLSHLKTEDVDNFLCWFSAVVKLVNIDALFVFIDLDYKKDRNGKELAPAIVFRRLIEENFLSMNGLTKIDAYTHDEEASLEVHHEDTTQTLLNEIFTGEFCLWHRWMTYFYFVVLQKI